MKKLLSFFLVFLMISPALAEESVPEFLQKSLGIDIEAADAQTLKSVVEGIDISISPFSQAIEYCLSRLGAMGQTQWVAEYREKHPDNLSALSYDELVALKDRINLAMWQSAEWQEVTVPIGLYVVGEDIPAGHWSIKTKNSNCTIKVSDKIKESKKAVDFSHSGFYYDQIIHNKEAYAKYFNENSDIEVIDIVLYSGLFVEVEWGAAIFTPYTGKPSLGFK